MALLGRYYRYGCDFVDFNTHDKEKLIKELRRLQTILAKVPAVIYTYKMVAGKRLFTYVNEKVVNVLGLEAKAIMAEPDAWIRRVHPEDLALLEAGPGPQNEKHQGLLEFRFDCGAGDYCWLQEKQNVTTNEEGETEIVAICWDITERKLSEERIRYMSFHDTLTGLYNRVFMEEEMQRLDTQRQLPLSIIMADLNDLKLINDTYGHEMGDELLITVARTLRASCRREDILSRWGGDEFVILLPKTTRQEAERLGKRIRKNCRANCIGDIPISLALGVASKKDPAVSLYDVLKEAEVLMYKQKLADSKNTGGAVLNALLKTLETKSFEKEEHVCRMQVLALKFGEVLGLPDSELNRLSLLVTLRDIGKISIPKEILIKEGPLTAEEWEIMRKHPETGYRITRSIEEFALIAEDILAHHENWDGSGYPRGLKGEQIPFLARITALVSAYEAMTSGRPYRRALSPAEAAAELRKAAGKQFDPDLVPVFLQEVVGE